MPLRFLPLILTSACAFATETDQFTSPSAPLRDLGPQLSRQVVDVIQSDRTGRAPELVLAAWAGRNPFTSRPARWIQGLPQQDARFRPSALRSVYAAAFSPIPATFFAASPTVNLYGYYMGTDKVDHFFRQGFEYFKLAQQKGVAAAVARGVRQERGFLGTLSSGVYSNADLAANYAGMKFYQSLREVFEPSPEGWRLRPGLDPGRLLEPYLSHHLDESLNPSRYRFSRSTIAARIRARCATWSSFYRDRAALATPPGQDFAATWFGEDYGHWLPPADEVSIATVCPSPGP